MAPNDHLLANLCREEETLTQARALLRVAQTKTGPGSGFQLGPYTTGLPAICAYIASQRLNNGDVSLSAARVASCLKASDFDKAFSIVEAAIPGRKPNSTITYDHLIRRYNIPMTSEKLVPWMREAERALLQIDGRFSPERDDVKCAIFLWVCSVIKGVKYIFPLQSFSDDNKIALKSLRVIYDHLKMDCSTLKDRIIEAMKPKRASPTKVVAKSASGLRTPSKAALRTLPTKGSPQKRRVVFSQSEPEQVDDIDMLTPETPSKRRKLESPSKSSLRSSPVKNAVIPAPVFSLAPHGDTDVQPATHNDPSTPRRRSRHTQNITVDVDHQEPASGESDPDEPLVRPRRFRPVYLDHKQWYSHDPRVDGLWKHNGEYAQRLAAPHNHPF